MTTNQLLEGYRLMKFRMSLTVWEGLNFATNLQVVHQGDNTNRLSHIVHICNIKSSPSAICQPDLHCGGGLGGIQGNIRSRRLLWCSLRWLMCNYYRSKTGEARIVQLYQPFQNAPTGYHHAYRVYPYLPSLCPSPEKATNFGFGLE